MKEGVHFKPKSIFYKLKELSSILRILSPGPDNYYLDSFFGKKDKLFLKIYLSKVALIE